MTGEPLHGEETFQMCFRLSKTMDEDGHQTTGARGAARDVADGARVENA